MRVPWVPDVFLACFLVSFMSVGPKRDMTDTGNNARKTSGTQGRMREKMNQNSV